MPTKKQLAAQLAALNAKTAKDVAAAQAEIDTTNATIAAADQPVVEEMPEYLVGMPYRIPTPSIETINQSIANDTFLPGVLKEGIQVGPLPENVLKALNVKSLEAMNPNAVGWRIVTDANGTQRLEVQESDGSITGYGARVGGAAVPGANNASSTAGSDYAAKLQADYYAAKDKEARQSAYDLLYSQFKQYGLESLVEGIKGLIQENVSPSEFAIRLQDTDAYKKRFAANQDRIKAGLRALTPAEYIGLEDQYQNIMRNYGLPSSY